MASSRLPLRGALASAALVICGVALPHATALAWGADGHRLIASVAEKLLTPQARAEVNRLLEQEPGASLASISTWADEVRNPATATWHYVNFQRGEPCVFKPETDCAGNSCVVSAIERQTAVLASAESDEKRLLALKYVVHFVGDVHQPLHAGYGDNRGGNSFQHQAFGRGTNLHSVWDGALLRNWPGGLPALQEALEAETTAAGGKPAAWAEESCGIVGLPGFYPEGRTVDDAYPAKWAPTMRQQLSLAARRLAATLNASFRGK